MADDIDVLFSRDPRFFFLAEFFLSFESNNLKKKHLLPERLPARRERIVTSPGLLIGRFYWYASPLFFWSSDHSFLIPPGIFFLFPLVAYLSSNDRFHLTLSSVIRYFLSGF